MPYAIPLLSTTFVPKTDLGLHNAYEIITDVEEDPLRSRGFCLTLSRIRTEPAPFRTDDVKCDGFVLSF